MAVYELIYFSGCPNVDRARSFLLKKGVSKYSEVNQDDLADDHPLRDYSSPTILEDGRPILGGKAEGASCTFICED